MTNTIQKPALWATFGTAGFLAVGAVVAITGPKSVAPNTPTHVVYAHEAPRVTGGMTITRESLERMRVVMAELREMEARGELQPFVSPDVPPQYPYATATETREP